MLNVLDASQLSNDRPDFANRRRLNDAKHKDEYEDRLKVRNTRS
jgi:hypothetical protein